MLGALRGGGDCGYIVRGERSIIVELKRKSGADWGNKNQSFKKRAADIADHAHNPRGALGEGADFLRGLDEMERQRQSFSLCIAWPLRLTPL